MEFDEIDVKVNPGICRCCLSEGCYKELSSEYSWMTETEVYADMLLDCFDISISQHNEGPNGAQRLICEVCITRLRDACNFKKQVLESEKKFVDMLSRGDFRPKVMVFEDSMKEEKHDEDIGVINEVEVEYLDEDMDYVDDTEYLQTETDIDQPSVSKDTTSKLQMKVKRGRPRKSPELKPEKKIKVTKTKVEEKIKKSAVKELKPSMPGGCTTKCRRQNLVTILTNTTIIPFRGRNRYICFYCGVIYNEYKEFVKHTKCHTRFEIEKHGSLKRRREQFDIRLDVSDITCEICSVTFPDYDTIVDHLIHTHNLNYNKDIDMGLDKFRLIDLKCLMCEKYFNQFTELVKHVNNHHKVRNSYICNECGHSYNKIRLLLTHIKRSHNEGIYACNKCPMVFRKRNLLNAHKGEHLAPCSICNKKYSSKSGKRNHMKLFHNQDLSLKHEVFVESQISQNQQSVISTIRNLAKIQKENMACVVNMTTALPFKFYGNMICCFYCLEKYEDNEDLRVHTNMHHPTFDVVLKKRRLKQITGLSGFLKIDISLLSCRLCYLHFESLDSIIEHLILCHKAMYNNNVKCKIQPFVLKRDDMRCPVCDESFIHFRTLYLHINKTHADKGFLCSSCGEGFPNNVLLKMHIARVHPEPGAFKCNICNIESKSENLLNTHKAKVHGIIKVKCSNCTGVFPSQYEMKKHMLTAHNIGHKCIYCNRMFIKDSFMRQHVKRIHLKERNVECSICYMRFFNNSMLQIHMVKHRGVKNYHCDICGKSFFWKKNVISHMARHNKGIKPPKLIDLFHE